MKTTQNQLFYCCVTWYTFMPHFFLTHWGWVTHIYISKLTIIVPDYGLLPGRHQAIIWINAGLFLIGPLGTNFGEMYIEILTFSFKKMHLKVSSAKWWPFCLGLNVLREPLSNHRNAICSPQPVDGHLPTFKFPVCLAKHHIMLLSVSWIADNVPVIAFWVCFLIIIIYKGIALNFSVHTFSKVLP